MSAPSRFHKLTREERIQHLIEVGFIQADDAELLATGGLGPDDADRFVENAVGIFAVPTGLAVHLVVNGRSYCVPMVIEEPSVVAAQSHACKLVAAGGGFTSEATDPIMVGQIQLLDVPDPLAAAARITAAQSDWAELARGVHPRLEERGGGLRGVETRVVSHPDGERFVVVHLLVDVRDAMGANMLNTLAERLAEPMRARVGGRIGLRILSNLADRRLVRTTCRIPHERLAWKEFSADEVARGIVDASRFAEADPYRAATHNKGIMNGVDAVLLATGNDWRAVEAAAHAFASRSGTYRPLSRFFRDEAGALCGELEIPMPVGVVGGATVLHPLARRLLAGMGIASAQELSCVLGAVGLAQNLAALKALATEGIQNGHMRLHQRRLSPKAEPDSAESR